MKFLFVKVCLAGVVFMAACSPPPSSTESNPNSALPTATADETVMQDPPMPISSAPPAKVVQAPAKAAEPLRASSPSVAANPLAAKNVPAPTPHPALGATEAALRAYPDLAKPNSMFNRAFRDLHEERLKTNPASLAKPDWPLVLARETADMLAPANGPAAAAAAAAPKAGEKVAANTAAKPNWLQERMGKGNALDMPAYDQRRAVYPRSYYYYTDGNGRFWIDRYGNRHY